MRPYFSDMWEHFRFIYGNGSPQGVADKIGGHVAKNIQNGIEGGFINCCAIRMSFCLNLSGVQVPYMSGQTVSGADRFWYIYRVKDLHEFLVQRFGQPDFKNNRPSTEKDVSEIKGILLFEGSLGGDSTGHATLWDGASCSDHCYFDDSRSMSLWKLN